MRLNNLTKLVTAGAAALALGGLAPAGASAHNCGPAADSRPTRSTAADPAVRASQDLQRRAAAAGDGLPDQRGPRGQPPPAAGRPHCPAGRGRAALGRHDDLPVLQPHRP